MSPTTRPGSVWRRPLPEHDRQRVFAITAVALLLIAAALTIARPAPDPASPPADHAAARPTTSAPAASAPAATPPTTSAAPSPAPATRARALAHASERQRRAAARVGRGFLTGYLRYLYRGRPATAIDGTSPALRRQLAREQPRRRPRAARRPHVVAVVVERRSGGWQLRARVRDGAHAFPVVLLLADRHGRPVVTAIGGA